MQRSSKAVSGPTTSATGKAVSVSLNSKIWPASAQEGHSGAMVGTVCAFGFRWMAVEKTAC